MKLKDLLLGGVAKRNEHKQFLLEWQNEVIRAKDKTTLITDEKQLRKLTIEQMKRDTEIINDCLKLMNSTYNPETFFMRLNLMKEKIEHICKLDIYVPFKTVNNTYATSEDLYEDLISNYYEAIQQFIIKYFNRTLDKVDKLKTPKARIKRYDEFYDSLKEYYCYMNEKNIGYIETKYNAFKQLELRK